MIKLNLNHSKECTKCKTIKKKCLFRKNERGYFGLASWCLGCESQLTKSYNKKNIKKIKLIKRLRRLDPAWIKKNESYVWRKTYKLNHEQYELMLRNQGGGCAICGAKSNGASKTYIRRRFCIDHNHVTGKVRGLLCVICNAGLGNFRTDIRKDFLLKKASEYILKND